MNWKLGYCAHCVIGCEKQDLSYRPHMRTNAGFHRRSDPQGLVHAGKVVMHVEQRNHRHMVVEFLTESVRQPSKSAHVHSHVEILPLHIAGADMLWIGVAD